MKNIVILLVVMQVAIVHANPYLPENKMFMLCNQSPFTVTWMNAGSKDEKIDPQEAFKRKRLYSLSGKTEKDSSPHIKAFYMQNLSAKDKELPYIKIKDKGDFAVVLQDKHLSILNPQGKEVASLNTDLAWFSIVIKEDGSVGFEIN